MKINRQGKRFAAGRWASVMGLCIGLAVGPAEPADAATGAIEDRHTESAGQARVLEVQPQGRVSGVQAVQVSFSQTVAASGDSHSLPPVTLDYAGLVPTGQGRGPER